ncbi:MAG: JAB domain-containing protein [Bacteroidetes bacterium]|nr:JAB domain-containing protein [Bacteroidota bacterium]
METKSNYKNKLRKFETSLNLAEIEVKYKTKQKEKIAITKSKDAFDILYSLYNKDTIEFIEQFYLLLLNKANKVLGWINLSTGGTTGTVVDVKIIFALALKTNASGIIVSHNHPSQNLIPSEEDKRLTKLISDAGNLFNIRLLDHIIITSDETYYSFVDEGII